MSYAPPELGGKTQLVTVEGTMAVQDAVEFLEKQQRLCPLIFEDEDNNYNSPMDNFAQHPVEVDPIPAAFFSDDKKARKQAARESSLKKGKWAEFCWFGPPGSPPSKIVEDLIVDDGEMKRKHRLAVFNPTYRIVRVTIRETKKGRIFCRLHFNSQRFKARACRICGRCEACDRSCALCWTLHRSPPASRTTSPCRS